MSPSIMICPATCELCGQWMPGHSKDCPRSGVHPSQWSLTNLDDPIMFQENNDNIVWEEKLTTVAIYHWSPSTRNMKIMADD